MTVWIKQGTICDFKPVVRKGVGRVAELYKRCKDDLYITSGIEGAHSDGSFHYEGYAFDFRYGKATRHDIKEALGPGWDVIFHRTHIHAEYDPK